MDINIDHNNRGKEGCDAGVGPGTATHETNDIKDHSTNLPSVVYQNVELDINPLAEHLTGQTTLWLLFKEAVSEGFSFRIHSRSVHISEVTVNGVAATFRRRDGLHTLFPSQKVYYAGDIDLQYRAALEIAREGELEIVVPNISTQTLRPPVSVPKHSPPEVHMRYNRLMETYLAMKKSFEAPAPSVYDIEDVVPPEDKEKTQRKISMLQVRIKYRLNCSANTFNSQPTALIFRKQPSCVKYFDQQASSSKSGKAEKTVCVYTGAYGSSLRNVDGVRCWLPTVDYLDQRFIFDLTFSIPKAYNVLCSGKRIPITKTQRQQQFVHGKARRFFHRFFTPFRIPAAQLGFFIGKVESYKMPLYKMKGKVWVATGLGDYLGLHADDPLSKPDEPTVATASGPIESSTGEGHKRSRSEMESGNENSAQKVAKVDKNLDATERGREAMQEKEKPARVIKSRLLYEDQVYHTFLGLELGVKVLQNFAGHKYDYPEFVYIFVFDLGRDFIAFDGFVLIDMRFMHSSSRVYMETPAHLTLVQSFLYSWLRTAIPVASYDCEFIIHGVVGYLMLFYCEEVYGEDDGQYYLQKMLDCVLGLEKQGRAQPLSSFYPERYEVFTLYFGEYLYCKSTTLFHMIEQSLGGKDPMRVVLKHMIKSPLLFAQSHFRTFSSQLGDQSPSYSIGSSPMAMSDSPLMGMSPPYSQGNESPSDSLRDGTPTHNSAMSSPIHHGDASPRHMGYQSPYPYYQNGNTSPQYIPYHGAGRYTTDPMTGQLYQQGGMSSLYRPRGDSWGSADDGGLAMPKLHRALSVGSDWEKDLAVSTTETLTIDNFLALLRHATETSIEIDDAFLEKFLHECNALFVRINVEVSERVENKPRVITITTEQIGHKTGGFRSKHHAKCIQMDALMIEDRDNHTTQPTLTVSDRTEKYTQIAFSRPGRKGGKRRKQVDIANLPEEEQRERMRAEREKELRKSALKLVQSLEFPVRYIILDPSFKHISEVHHIASDAVSVEQLNVLYEENASLAKHKVRYQVQALRSLSRSLTAGISQAIPQIVRQDDELGASASISFGRVAHKSARVQLKAFADCILGVTGDGFDSKTEESTMSVFVRGEAAFAMAYWQNENAPFSVTEDYDPVRDWPGMELLVDCILELFVDTQLCQPLVQDHRNEGSLYLRNCLLLALSTIKSQQGYSPREVVDMLLLFAEHIDDPLDEDEAAAQRESSGRLRTDETHSVAALFLAMSRLRHAPIDVTRTSQPVFRSINILKSYLHDAFTEARTMARINHVRGDANILPRLPCEGLAVAAALTSLSEIDIQAISDFCSARGHGGEKLRALDHAIGPAPSGIITEVVYHDYFVRPGHDLKLVDFLKKDHRRGIKEEFIYYLCTPVVRLAAFEAFIRLCFAQHHGKMERLELRRRASSGTSASTQAKEEEESFFFIPAAVEALQHLLDHDPSVYVRQQAATIFFDVILERPPRVVMESLSLGQPWGCMGWSDVMAFTAPHRLRVAKPEDLEDRKVFVSPHKTREVLFKTQPSRWQRIALDAINKVINRSSCNQVVRTALLQMWAYTFRLQAPKGLVGNAIPPHYQGPLKEEELAVRLSKERLYIYNPTEVFWDFEQSLKLGPKYHPPKSADAAQTISKRAIQPALAHSTSSINLSVSTSSSSHAVRDGGTAAIGGFAPASAALPSLRLSLATNPGPATTTRPLSSPERPTASTSAPQSAVTSAPTSNTERKFKFVL